MSEKIYRKSSDNRKRLGKSKPYRFKKNDEGGSYDSKFSKKREGKSGRSEEEERLERFGKRKSSKFEEPDHLKRDILGKSHYSKRKQLAHHLKQPPIDGMIRLNKFIANAGVCSRREADEYITKGRITVNGKVVSEVGIKVKVTDDIRLDKKRITTERKVYLVLNKPKDFVTTVDDPLDRKTVMRLIEKACKERVYPVGRLDRMTTGILLFTNDGELTKKLTHPRYEKKKIYHVFLNKPVVRQDIKKISEGIELEDGFVKADDVSYVDNEDKSQVGIEIHSGKNRIIRRIFEHLGYDVEKLDRVFFAGITKKNLPRGRWRFLTDSEINLLKNY